MATIDDVAMLLASYLIEQNRDTLTHISKQLGELMSNQENLDQRVAFLSTQVQEVVDEIQKLKEQVAGMNVDFSGLDAAIQPLADIVPDVEVPEDPEPEPEG